MGSKDTKTSPDLILKGHAEILQHMFSFADSMALKSAVELHIADIIHSHNSPITLTQIASAISSTSPDITYLGRIMRFLVRRNIFTVHPPSDGAGETRYGLSYKSRWILHGTQKTLVPLLLMENHPQAMAPWHCFSQCVKEGGVAFEKAHGVEIWEFASRNPEFNKLFNDGMACTAAIHIESILQGYKDGFGSIGSLVDVGGGTGEMIGQIVKSHPHIKGINFDLPHVVSTAPVHHGVSHVGGDMFQAIPNADAIIMKWVLHDWGDEDCVKILKNCRKSVPPKTGKVIIIDLVLRPDRDDTLNDLGFAFDLLMMAHSSGGKERTELEWKQILEGGGFPKFKVITLPSTMSIIEAYHD